MSKKNMNLDFSVITVVEIRGKINNIFSSFFHQKIKNNIWGGFCLPH
jgi:hypothetical protein